MGLMGGGPRQGSGGALRVASLYPFCEETLAVNMVPPIAEIESENAPIANRLINEQTMFPGIDIIKNHDESSRDIIENFDKKIDEILTADVERRTKGKGDADVDATNSTLRSSNMLVFRSLVAGALLHFDVSTDERASDIQNGFLIICVQKILNDNTIGGMSRVGIGTDVFDLNYASFSLEADGERIFEYDEAGNKLVIAEGSKAAAYVDAFKAWEDGGKAWTADSLWHATGFEGIDLSKAAVKKAKPAGKGKGAAKPKNKGGDEVAEAA